MKVKIVSRQHGNDGRGYLTLIRDCHKIEQKLDRLKLIDDKGNLIMMISEKNILYLEVFENAGD